MRRLFVVMIGIIHWIYILKKKNKEEEEEEEDLIFQPKRKNLLIYQ